MLFWREVLNLAEKRVLMVIAPQNFRDEEFEEPRRILQEAGASVTVASARATAKGMFGTTVRPDLTLDKVRVDDYDAVIFVGGSGAATYFEDERALAIAKDAAKKGKKVGAICIAPVILANAGLLEGKRATVWDGDFARRLKEKGAKYTGKPVEVDGNIITANGPAAAKEFGKVIARELGLGR
jgi:protease I